MAGAPMLCFRDGNNPGHSGRYGTAAGSYSFSQWEERKSGKDRSIDLRYHDCSTSTSSTQRATLLQYLVAVRALCEFTAKHGDLDLRFTPSPSPQEGMAGHALVASRRGETYQAEVSLEGEYKALKVRGRADGYAPEQNQ